MRVLKINWLILILGICHGIPIVKPITGTFLGENWRSLGIEPILVAHCPYIGILAVAGGLETFMSATMTPEWIQFNQMATMIVFCVNILVTVVLGRSFGPLGIVFGSILIIIMRTVIAMHYAWKRLELEIKDLLPIHRSTLVTCALALIVNHVSLRIYDPMVLSSTHTLVILGSLLISLAIISGFEFEDVFKRKVPLFSQFEASVSKAGD